MEVKLTRPVRFFGKAGRGESSSDRIDLIWTGNMPEWIPAGTVVELQDEVPAFYDHRNQTAVMFLCDGEERFFLSTELNGQWEEHRPIQH